MSKTLIQLKHVTKSFGANIVLDDFSFSVVRNSHTIITGQSGSGKTTLLRILALLEPVDDGDVLYLKNKVTTYLNQPLIAQSLSGVKIGYVSQELDLWPHLTVTENIDLALRLQNTINTEQATKLVLDNFGLDRVHDQYPTELSGGQRQRCAIARALVHRPDILLLDEITASLDEENITRVMNALEYVADQGVSMVLVSHRKDLPTNLFKHEVHLKSPQ